MKVNHYFCVVSIFYDRYFYKTLTLKQIKKYLNEGYKIEIQAVRYKRKI